jgi:hypothetical protein
MLRNTDAAEVKEPSAKGLSKATADGMPRTSKNCPNTLTKRSKQKQKVKQQKEGLCIFLKGQRTAQNWKQTSTREGLHWTFQHPSVLAATLQYKKILTLAKQLQAKVARDIRRSERERSR